MTKHTRKVIRGSFLTAVIVAAAVADQAQSKLLIPINTNFSYWDHHWIMWIPRHPLYEAVEVLSVDSTTDPRSGGQIQNVIGPVREINRGCNQGHANK